MRPEWFRETILGRWGARRVRAGRSRSGYSGQKPAKTCRCSSTRTASTSRGSSSRPRRLRRALGHHGHDRLQPRVGQRHPAGSDMPDAGPHRLSLMAGSVGGKTSLRDTRRGHDVQSRACRLLAPFERLQPVGQNAHDARAVDFGGQVLHLFLSDPVCRESQSVFVHRSLRNPGQYAVRTSIVLTSVRSPEWVFARFANR